MGITRDNSKRNYSRYDQSGTDPNRYASVSNADEADNYLHKHKKGIIPGLRTNVGTTERILMVMAGGYLLYRALKKDDKAKVAEGITGGTMLFRGITGYCPAYAALENSKTLSGKNVNIRTSITVNKPVDRVYEAWRNLDNLPQFMTHLEKVVPIDNYTSEWTAKLSGIPGASVTWRAEILMDETNKLLSWHSLPGADVHNAGKIRFTEVDEHTTELDITISYHAPLGKAGEAVAKLLNPVLEKMILKDVEGFKEYMEEKN